MTALPQTMTAIEIASPGGPEALVACTRPVPHPGPNELLVRVAAAGVNRPDVLQRRGLYPPPAGVTDIPGLELTGEVVATGGDARRWRVGDAVTALVAGGGYAEYCVVPTPQALPIPAGLSPAQAAALPETFFTVWDNVFRRAALQPGERLLVHGGGGGIGTTAIQLGAAFGATVFATSGGAEKCAACERLGATRAVDYMARDFEESLRAAIGGEGVDVILDIVGGDTLDRNLRLLRPGGRLSILAFQRGSRAEADFLPLLTRGLTVFGATLRGRTVAEKGAIAADLERRVWPLLARGRIAPVLDRTFPLVEAAEAHRRLESGRHFGKIVLIPARKVEPGPENGV